MFCLTTVENPLLGIREAYGNLYQAFDTLRWCDVSELTISPSTSKTSLREGIDTSKTVDKDPNRHLAFGIDRTLAPVRFFPLPLWSGDAAEAPTSLQSTFIASGSVYFVQQVLVPGFRKDEEAYFVVIANPSTEGTTFTVRHKPGVCCFSGNEIHAPAQLAVVHVSPFPHHHQSRPHLRRQEGRAHKRTRLRRLDSSR